MHDAHLYSHDAPFVPLGVPMKKILVLCLSLLVLTAFGCKSTSDGDSAPALAADAKSDSANAVPACVTIQLDPNAIVDDDVVAVMQSFADGLENSARNANGDCDKFIKNQNDFLDACEQNIIIAMAASMLDESLKSRAEKESSHELYAQMFEQCKGEDMEKVNDRITEMLFAAMLASGTPIR